MAFVHGTHTYINVSDSSGTARDISAYCNQVSGLPGTRDLAETTSFGANGTQSIPGLENTNFSVAGSFDPTDTSGPHAVLNSLRTADTFQPFVYGPQGNSSGNVKISGNCWLSKYELESKVDDAVSFSAEFQVEGVVSVGLFS